MALYDDEDVSYSEEGEDEFSDLAAELLPDADPEKLRRLIQICVEEDRKSRDGGEDDDKGKGAMLMIGLGGPKSKK